MQEEPSAPGEIVTKCEECGLELQDTRDSGHGTLCPTCSAPRSVIEMAVEETVRISDYFMLEAQSEGRTVGFRESERGGRSASGDDHGNGSLSLMLIGTSPQGEEDTLDACRVVVRSLNRMGGGWNEPVTGMGNIDCVATRATGATVEPLSIQVVKALVNPELWRTLATSGTLAKPDVAVEELTDLMADALQKKLDPSKIPPTQRPGLVLVLDATRLPALAFDSVVNIFRERHRVMLETAGFREIWIAGPIESLTKRLDTA